MPQQQSKITTKKKFVILLLILIAILTFCCHLSQSRYISSVAPIFYMGAGRGFRVGYVQDINNDKLPDIILSYSEREYNIVSTSVFMNNGCGFERHSSEFMPLNYCPQYFQQVRRVAWGLNPPRASIRFGNSTRSVTLPFNEIDFWQLMRQTYQFEVFPGEYYSRGNQIMYRAIRNGNLITVLGRNLTAVA